MNLYILVEDGKSGHKIIDHWIPLLLPTLTRAPNIQEMTDNQYVIYSGLGYPRILGTDRTSPSKNVLGQTIETINEIKKFDYLLIFLDGDDEGVEKRIDIVTNKISHYPEPLSCPFIIFVQNKCLETSRTLRVGPDRQPHPGVAVAQRGQVAVAEVALGGRAGDHDRAAAASSAMSRS